MEKFLKQKKGITLIALVITIIVLLILAGISISMLSGDNGLLKRAGDARDETVAGQEKEQVELAYISAAIKKLGGDVNKTDLQTELNSSVGTGKTIVSPNANDTLNVNFTDTKHNYTVDAGRVTRTSDGEFENSGGSLTGVDFGTGKTATTIEPGEDLTIGTESFRVLSKNENQIIAVPYYNITLVTPEENNGEYPNQTTEKPELEFSTEPYWEQGTDTIDMLDSRNNIQKYITAYSTKLSNATGGKVTARIARYSEMNASGVTKEIRNPGIFITENYYERYWIGSCDTSGLNYVWKVNDSGNVTNEKYTKTNGVRPLIVISLV